MQTLLNRYGQCPNCETGWDGGDVVEVLGNLDVFKHKGQKELLQIAAECFGYTPLNPLRFTRLNSIDLTGLRHGEGFWQCPVCSHVWDKKTNEEFNSIKIALNPVGANFEDSPPFELD